MFQKPQSNYSVLDRTERIVKAVLFDHDDTLVATFEPKSAHHKYIAKTFYQKEVTDDEIRVHWGKPLPTLMKILYGTDDAETALAHNIATRAEFPKRLFDGTLDTLAALRARGLKTGIVTSTVRPSLAYDFETLGISPDLFDYVQTQEETEHHKPDPRVFAPAVAWLATQGISPAETLYIGDTLLDMRAAQGAGFQFLGVATGLLTPDDFARHGARAIASLPELCHIE